MPENGTAAEKSFISVRTDGLGERLQAVVNAAALASLCDAPFKFTWVFSEIYQRAQHEHAIRHPHDTFEAEYMAAHVLSEDPGKLTVLNQTPRTIPQLKALLAAAPIGLSVTNGYLTRLVTTDIETMHRVQKEAFWGLGFLPDIRAAMERARRVPMPGYPVAVHLRAGDIIYGRYRFGPAFNGKALSYPVAKKIIADLVAQGKYPVLFGQDDETCRLLVKPFGLKLGVDILGAPDADPLAAALSEIVLMSRCQAIYAGSSGFARIAAMISGQEIQSLAGILSKADIVMTIETEPDLADDSVLSDLQKAFSYYTAVHIGWPKYIQEARALPLIERAIHFDGFNPYYPIVRAAFLAALGRTKEAEAVAKAVVIRFVGVGGALGGLLTRTVTAKARDGEGLWIDPYLALLEKVAGRTTPYCQYLLTLADHARGRKSLALKHLAVAIAAAPDEVRFTELRQRL